MKTQRKSGKTKKRRLLVATSQRVKAKGHSQRSRVAAQDDAHAPGHRKLNLRDQFPGDSGEKVQIQASAINQMAADERINRTTARKRINGFVISSGQRRRSGAKRTPS